MPTVKCFISIARDNYDVEKSRAVANISPNDSRQATTRSMFTFPRRFLFIIRFAKATTQKAMKKYNFYLRPLNFLLFNFCPCFYLIVEIRLMIVEIHTRDSPIRSTYDKFFVACLLDNFIASLLLAS